MSVHEPIRLPADLPAEPDDPVRDVVSVPTIHAMAALPARPKLLCVDAPHALDALAESLRRFFVVTTTTSGREALGLLAAEQFAVLMCDMRMPGIDIGTLLAGARQIAPDTTRVLLVAKADADAAIPVINDGEVFRFLTKPVSRDDLVLTLQAAAEQHRLVATERAILEQTLGGAVDALLELLALAEPTAFARGGRVRGYASQLAQAEPRALVWQAELASWLMHLGYISLAAPIAARINAGEALGRADNEALEQLPRVAERLLRQIPRLDGIREILKEMTVPFDESDPDATRLEARILRIAVDYELLETQGLMPEIIMAVLRGREGRYDTALLDRFTGIVGAQGEEEIRELPLSRIELGMVFAQDVKSAGNGTLLVARGLAVGPALLERLRAFPAGYVNEPLKMIIPFAVRRRPTTQ